MDDNPLRLDLKIMKEHAIKLKNEMQEKTMTFLTAAFGLVVGLAWNDAVKALIEFLFPIQKNTLLAKFIYALILTIIFVIITVYVARMFKDNQEDKE